MFIDELKDKQSNVDIKAIIIEKEEPREFEKFGKKGKVCNAKIKDETGSIKLTLWNDEIDKVKIGDKIKISNGYITEWKGEKQLSIGKYGILDVNGDDEIKEEFDKLEKKNKEVEKELNSLEKQDKEIEDFVEIEKELNKSNVNKNFNISEIENEEKEFDLLEEISKKKEIDDIEDEINHLDDKNDKNDKNNLNHGISLEDLEKLDDIKKEENRDKKEKEEKEEKEEYNNNDNGILTDFVEEEVIDEDK
jgi:replication factor A1